MSFKVSHIYCEGKHCDDKLASIGLKCPSFHWSDGAPSVILKDLGRNMLDLPCYRFFLDGIVSLCFIYCSPLLFACLGFIPRDFPGKVFNEKNVGT